MKHLRPFLLLPLLLVPLSAIVAEQPWWDKYPRIVQGKADYLKSYHADVLFSGGLNAPTWGIWGQVILNRPKAAEAVHAQGGRMITYFETFGQSYCVVVAIPDTQLNTEKPRPSATHWNWKNYKGDPVYWAGAHSWFDDLPEARPYTRTHPVYGGPPMRYPDGRIATGYAGDPANPMNHRAFDAGCSKDILGAISFETHRASPAVQKNGPHTGLLKIGDAYVGVALMQKDSACPHWLDLDEAAVRYAASHGADGMWSDNFSPWDSFNQRPIERGFGEWSVALFRGYLKEHFDVAALSAMGVDDVDSFDVRTAFRQQIRDWGGDDTNLRDPKWRDKRWLDHDLWHAYVIFKRQQGTEALTAYDHRMRAAAASVGKPDFLIAGNDIPGLSLGWVRGELDMVSTESSAGYALDAGSRGLMLPPLGRHSVRYRLAQVHARSRLVNIWPYVDGEYARYQRNANLTRVMAYEMLAACALPMPHPDLPRVLGDAQAYQEFFTFVGKAREYFGQRIPVARTGIYYSSSSLLAFMTPGGFFDFNHRPHQFGYYGWATALHDLHEAYVPVPEWKLSATILAGLDLLIIPHASAIEEKEIAVLQAWIAQGGRLIVTGDSGSRGGENGNYATRNEGPLHARLDPSGVHHIDENVGMAYYLQAEERSVLAASMAAHLSTARGETTPLIVTQNTPATVGITPYVDAKQFALFVDLNNLAIDLETDIVEVTDTIVFDIALPEALRDRPLQHRVLSPEPGITATLSPLDDGRIRITLSPLHYYASVMITPANE